MGTCGNKYMIFRQEKYSLKSCGDIYVMIFVENI